jgi:hypothetical protein
MANTTYPIQTITGVRNSFWEMFKDNEPSLYKEEYRKYKRQNQYSADIRFSFIDYVNNLERDGNISRKLASRVTL